MAKQTINIGASPNDGTGTPLRTAFDYTNQNFTELYTATGPSGNNIVVPGSATITGDLTVDTSTLKVSASTDTVTVGATTTDSKFRVIDANYNGLRIGFLPGTSNYNLYDATVHEFRTANVTPQQLYTFQASSAVWFDGAGGTRMTLNSTGLGIGAAPEGRLNVANTATPVIFSMTLVGAQRWQQIIDTTAGNWTLRDQTGSIDALIVKAGSGNVGIGVTPSSWGGSYKALQLQSVARSIASTGAGVGDLTVAFNAIYDSTDSRWEYAGTGDKAGRYSQTGSGNHRWFVSNTAGTAGNEITDFASAAMTLDASGNLLVGATSAVASGSTFQNLGTARQVLTLKGNDDTSYTLGLWSATTTGDNFFAYFGTEASTTVRGSVTYNRAGGLVLYNTTSDYRAKDIIGSVLNSGSLIDSLKVYVGKMKGATIERPMLIAHEVQEIAPYAVNGEKDSVDADGKPKYQQMDASALVPLLIAEIQSLRTRVQTLEAR